MTIAILILSIVGVVLLLGSVGLVWMACSGPSSTGNGAGAMAGLILISAASLFTTIGVFSLVASGILFLIKHFA